MSWLITPAVFVVIGIMAWALCASGGMIDDVFEKSHKEGQNDERPKKA